MAENNYSEHGSDTKIQIGDGGKKKLDAMGERYEKERLKKLKKNHPIAFAIGWFLAYPQILIRKILR